MSYGTYGYCWLLIPDVEAPHPMSSRQVAKCMSLGEASEEERAVFAEAPSIHAATEALAATRRQQSRTGADADQVSDGDDKENPTVNDQQPQDQVVRRLGARIQRLTLDIERFQLGEEAIQVLIGVLEGAVVRLRQTSTPLEALSLHSHQKRTVALCMAAILEDGCSQILLVAPTGSGKTVMLLDVTHCLLRDGRVRSILWIAERHELLDQARIANQRWFGMSLIRFATFASVPNGSYDLVVVDEGHHDASSTVSGIIAAVSPIYVLGATATPIRTDSYRLPYQRVIEASSIDELIADEVLCPFDLYFNDSDRSFVARYLEDVERWGRSVIFFRREAQAREAERTIREAGVPVIYVSGGSGRGMILDGFVRGAYAVLLSCRVLTEGVDIPHLDTVFVHDASAGPTLQMAGRVLRRAPGKALGRIVQSERSRYLMHQAATPEHCYRWSPDGWRIHHKPNTETTGQT